MSPPIFSMMTTPVVSVGMDDPLTAVEATLLAHRLTWAPVLDPGGAVVGVLAAADLLQSHARQDNPSTTSAWQVCSYKPLSVAPDTPVSEVARLMVQRGIHHVVVMDDGGLKGVVSSLDFVQAFAAP